MAAVQVTKIDDPYSGYKVTQRIGVDSQSVSYIIDAMQNVVEPKGRLAPEKTALFRIYLYLPGTFFVTPTVISECSLIPDTKRRELHDSFFTVFFAEVIVENQNTVDHRAMELTRLHRGENDCRILAEAEHGNLDTLLTYDTEMISHLADVSLTTRLARPTEVWATLGVPKGAKPDKVPHSTNPLGREAWWKW